jgi:hypothetical protein
MQVEKRRERDEMFFGQLPAPVAALFGVKPASRDKE